MGIGFAELLIIGVILAAAVCLPVLIVVLVLATRKKQPPAMANPNLAPCPDCNHLISVNLFRSP